MKYLNEQRKEQRLVAATIQNEDFSTKLEKNLPGVSSNFCEP